MFQAKLDRIQKKSVSLTAREMVKNDGGRRCVDEKIHSRER